jgi:hypothetical protein
MITGRTCTMTGRTFDPRMPATHRKGPLQKARLRQCCHPERSAPQERAVEGRARITPAAKRCEKTEGTIVPAICDDRYATRIAVSRPSTTRRRAPLRSG